MPDPTVIDKLKSSLFGKPTGGGDSPVVGPARAALLVAKGEHARIRELDAEWAAKESAATRDIHTHEEAAIQLDSIRQKRINALADIEVVGSSVDDPDVLARDIDSATKHLAVLKDAADLAAAKLTRYRAQREPLREQSRLVFERLPSLQHSALVEHLNSLAEEFIEREKAYIAALEKVYGASAACDVLAKQFPHFGWTGSLPLADLELPRPRTAAFAVSVATRQAIWEHITAEAERVATEIL